MSELAAKNWDAEYEAGRYAEDGPLAFVDTITEFYNKVDRIRRFGLDVGCGNGTREFLPLRQAGFRRLTGMDISPIAIAQLHEADESTIDDTFVGDFSTTRTTGAYDYLVSIQVFQHGDREAVDNFFAKSNQVLRPHGMFFLRVNSVATDMIYEHEITEDLEVESGQTIRYDEGPKSGQEIHFFTNEELGRLAAEHSFRIIQQPKEVFENRKPPLEGKWAQWETVWQKTP